MADGKEKLTTNAGAPVVDNQNVMTAGRAVRCCCRMSGIWRSSRTSTGRSFPNDACTPKAPARTATSRLPMISRATPRRRFSPRWARRLTCFTRFSTVAGERGAADAERDIRGFAMKFYTEEGNWDLVGNNTPVFFLRDPLKFPDLNHAVKTRPAHQSAQCPKQLGFLDLAPRGAAPDYHHDERSRNSLFLSPHARFWQPHL